jgi:hypothetical protein
MLASVVMYNVLNVKTAKDAKSAKSRLLANQSCSLRSTPLVD